jgi:hypothetical protein
MNWISVKDELPKETDRFLVAGKGCQPEIFVYLKFKGEGGKFQYKGHDYTDKVVYWMSLPPSPNKD